MSDLQQNSGGSALFAFDTFKQFFPTLDHCGGSRLRTHDSVNVMGDILTEYWNSLTQVDDDYYNLAADDWVSLDRINANTNRNFASWAEFYGPWSANGDSFTTIQRYNLLSYIFDMESVQDFDEYFAVYGYSGNPANTTQPFAADEIIILSDRLCPSTCAVFMEMMHHEFGVKTVVAGGYPMTGPMQTPSGSRGARLYSVNDVLDNNIAYTQYILQENNDQ